jgi:hypothetical protein
MLGLRRYHQVRAGKSWQISLTKMSPPVISWFRFTYPSVIVFKIIQIYPAKKVCSLTVADSINFHNSRTEENYTEIRFRIFANLVSD